MSEPGILPKPVPFGKYYLLERINVGGMAEVFKAKAFGVEGFERMLAIKQILPNIAEDKGFIEMFIDEAKIAVQLTHPNIAQIFDLGQVDGSYFIALEYISGKDLKTQYERARRIGEKISIPRVCYIMMKVCEGLGYAHEKKDPQGNHLQIIHRDISPQNILTSFEGEVKIIDFGIAKAQGKTSHTHNGMIKGKFSYMSPEQVRGLHVDHRSDIFSMGVVLYELLTLERLFTGESDFETLEKIRRVEMSPPSLYNPHIPKALEDIVLRALSGNPEERFQTAYEFGEALERFMRDQGYYYTNKDLAAYMKEAFSADIEFENKKTEYYRSLNLKPIEEAPRPQAPRRPAADLSWGDEEMETQIFGREDAIAIVDDADIVYADESIARVDESATQVHLSGAHAAVSEEASTREFERWDMNLDLGQSPRRHNSRPGEELDLDLDIEPRRSAPLTSQMPAVERRRDSHTTVPGAVTAPPANYKKRKKGGVNPGVIALVALLVIALGLGVVWMTRDTTAPVMFAFGEEPVRIYVDGQLVHEGPTPYEWEGSAGTYTVAVERDGFERYETKATLVAGEPTRLAEELTPLNYANTGFNVASTPEGAKVFIGDKEVEGITPVEIRDLAPGSYTLRVTLDEYFEAEKELEIKLDQVIDHSVALRPAKVDLRVTSDPGRADYTIYTAEGSERVARGRTPDTASDLDASRNYRVVISRRGYDDWEGTFEPGTEADATLDAELTRTESEPAVADARPATAASVPDRTGSSASSGSSRTETARAEPARETTTRREEPAPKPASTGTGTVSIASRPAARIYINDVDTGNYTPLMNHRLPAGTHKIVLVNPEFNLNKTFYVDLKPGGEERIINR
ncbi:PEGA domain-containing protein [Lujinxingia sediminis]|uniref:PEGA domain-containing protein n=1 Tax=Lujinxingia sediminis TaxID=2480984 RepID=A0ABY0CMX1_9DELT|nr:serine/threonine-protein kinase [Lujinxingia sediminis]RVU41000.1 PEGA domain-containing protein [Lujinxingia sediminis]